MNEQNLNSTNDCSLPAESNPIISVIIPHYNDLANLDKCLQLLAAQTLPRERFEIVVADNNSRCGLEEVQRVCGNLARVIHAPIQGAGPARNVAVEASRGQFLAFTDSDCRPSATWLERGLVALSTSDIVGGRIEVEVTDPAHPTGVEAFEKVFAFNFKRYIEKLGFSATCNMFVSRKIFDQVGGFRPAVAEDMDWGRRAVEANYRCNYGPDVVIAHPARRDWNELKQKWKRCSKEAYHDAKEVPNGLAIWYFRSFGILLSPFIHWITVIRSDKLDNLSQKLSAIGVLFAIRFWRFFECNRILLTR
ncbi:glycosyltransferase [uncultured Rhodoblastus sp.]|uniref:glycosyltransferase n=1 Tax=uncultured Rhodoblastus sp. TaxID=543037 RepID=UPI0025E27582|nr:glycosyltransferase [uncultured Rhodoblastus sp.]